jgi:CheY-like chemotaxis protein
MDREKEKNSPEGIKVLVAEDDYLVSKAVTRSLMECGFSVAGVASTGRQAVDMTCSLSPDLILMDIKMPEMDGLEATEEIQKRRPTPVVILTAYESQDLVHKATAAGISAYLTKPPNAKEIERAVSVALARHDDLMELRRLNGELEAAMAEIKILRGIIPICSFCKKIRDDKGYWERVDRYISNHTEAEVSHGVCPDCTAKYYSEINDQEDQN